MAAERSSCRAINVEWRVNMSHPHLHSGSKLEVRGPVRYRRHNGTKAEGGARGSRAGIRGGRAFMQENHHPNGDAGEGELIANGRTNIPTDLLRTFVAICELGSFTKTANLLDLTQPAVSAHMRRLESLIGADLIEKSLSGVSLTECGTEVLRYARRMLAINDQIVSGGGRVSQAQVVRLGIPNLYAPTVLARILEEREAIGGEYRLQVRCDHSRGLLRSVRSGYLELAALFASEADLDDAVVQWSEDLVWVRSPDFVLDPDDPVPLVSSPNLLLPDRAG